jgi:quinol monooxygenase YgiN
LSAAPPRSIVSCSGDVEERAALTTKGVGAVYARTTTVQARTSGVDDGIALMRDDVMPKVQDVPGSIGMSMLVDRDSGRCILTTAWSDVDAMHASAQTVKPMRDRLAEVLGGPPSIEEWEIAVLHRRRPADAGACARVTWLRAGPGGLDRAIDTYRSHVLPGLDDLAGFCSASLMVDRASGRAVSSVAYESREALEASRAAADDLRARTVQQLQAQVLETAEFDLVLSELRVPETV